MHGACGRTSQPLRAASSPIGEPSLTSPEREVARIARRRGQPRYAEYHLECTKANSYNPLAAPLGEVPRSGKGGVVGNFELFPFIEQHPLSQPYGLPAPPSGSQEGRCEFAQGFIKPQVPTAKPLSQPYGLPAPLSGEP